MSGKIQPDRRTPSWIEVIEAAVEKRLCNVFTQMPGKIVAYDFNTYRATIQPSLQRVYRADEAVVNLPLVQEVPICWESMSTSLIRHPVKVGDEGMIEFQMRSIDGWKTRGGTIDPQDNRKFSIADATFWPGLRPDGQRVPARGRAIAMELRNDKMMIELLPSGKIAIKNLATGDELLDLISQLIDSLIGESMIFNKATLVLIKTALTKMKG